MTRNEDGWNRFPGFRPLESPLHAVGKAFIA